MFLTMLLNVLATQFLSILQIITTNNAGHFNTKALQNLGKKNISTKHSSGLGLFLTMQILESFNGNLIINNLNNFVEVKIIIPFSINKYHTSI